MNRSASLCTAILLALLALTLVACQAESQAEAPTPTPIPTAVVPRKPLYTVERGDIVETMQFNGRVAPVVEREVTVAANGVVGGVYVAEGEQVEAGQIVADLEVLADLERRRQEQALAVRRAEIGQEIAALELERYRLTADAEAPGYAQQEGILERRVELARLGLEEIRMTLDELDAALDAARLTAPIDGVLLSTTLDPGDGVSAHEPVAVIARLDELEVKADLDDDELALLEEEMPVALTRSSRPGETIEGVIRRLPYPYGSAPAPDEAGGESVSGARIALRRPAEALGLSLGDRLRATVVLQVSEDTLWLPAQAVRTFDGRRFVVVQEGDVQQRVDVRLGLAEEGRVEVVEGLSEGQQVVGP